MVFMLFALFFVFPAIVGWISYAFKKRIGALVCAFSLLYNTIFGWIAVITANEELVLVFLLSVVPFFMYLASYFKQKALDAQDDF